MPKTPKDLAAAARAKEKKAAASATPPPAPQPPTPPDPITLAEITGERPLQAGILRDTPVISLKDEYHIIAARVAASLPPDSLYRLGTEYVTLDRDPATGRLKPLPMTAARLTTWLGDQRICYFCGAPRGNTPPPRTSLSPAQAEIILSSDILRAAVPEIDAVEHTRLPLIATAKKLTTIDPATGDSTTRTVYTFTPATPGYDPAKKLYTLDLIPIPWDKPMPLATARTLFCTAYSEAALDGGIGDGADLHPLQSRSLGAVVALHLGAFLHLNIRQQPILLALANQPGTGKTFIAQSILAPVYGEAQVSNYSGDERDLENTLNTLLLESAPYAFFDNLRGFINSPAMERLATAKQLSGRLFHTQKQFTRPNRMQLCITGNDLKLPADLERRSMPIDLFYPGDATKRPFKGIITEESILDPDTRSLFLHACWSIIHHWQTAGCPAPLPDSAFKSYPEFTRLAINPTIWAGFANPIGPRLVQLDAGDVIGAALIELLSTAADTLTPVCYGDRHTGLARRFTVSELSSIATAIDKLDIICPAARDKNNQLGIALRRTKGREYTDNRGRNFRIGSKRTAASSAYELLILTEPTHDLDDTAQITANTARAALNH